MPLFGKKELCPDCSRNVKTFNLRKEWNIDETQLYCDKCNRVYYNVSKSIEAYIGRITKGLDKSKNFRMIVEYPVEKAGQQIVTKLVPYTYTVYLKTTTKAKIGYQKLTITGGDRVAIGGSMAKGVFEAYFSKNLSVGLEEHLMPMVEAKIGILKKVRVSHPYSAIAKEKVVEIISRSEAEGKVSAPIDYHAQARNFELLICQLFEKMGFKNMNVSGGASDKGVDIEGYTTDESGSPQKIIIQCKHQSPSNPVKPTQVRDFAHTTEREKAYRGYFVTSSLFSPECFFKENRGEKMTLIDRSELQELLKRYGLSLDSVEKG